MLVEPEEIVKKYFYSCHGIEDRLTKTQNLLSEMLSYGREQVLKNMTELISLDYDNSFWDGKEYVKAISTKWEFEE